MLRVCTEKSWKVKWPSSHQSRENCLSEKKERRLTGPADAHKRNRTLREMDSVGA